jgi:hypothetical protein
MERRRKLRRAVKSHDLGIVESHVTYNAETCTVEVHTKCENIYVSEPFNARVLPTLISVDPGSIKKRPRSCLDLSSEVKGSQTTRTSCSLPQFEHSQYYIFDNYRYFLFLMKKCFGLSYTKFVIHV